MLNIYEPIVHPYLMCLHSVIRSEGRILGTNGWLIGHTNILENVAMPKCIRTGPRSDHKLQADPLFPSISTPTRMISRIFFREGYAKMHFYIGTLGEAWVQQRCVPCVYPRIERILMAGRQIHTISFFVIVDNDDNDRLLLLTCGSPQGSRSPQPHPWRSCKCARVLTEAEGRRGSSCMTA